MKLLPSLKQMEYLVALAETQHFGKASDLCNVTPSTLSAGIKDLEEVLGVSLAERTKRVVLMTPLGTDIANRARLVLRDAEDIIEHRYILFITADNFEDRLMIRQGHLNGVQEGVQCLIFKVGRAPVPKLGLVERGIYHGWCIPRARQIVDARGHR